MALTAKSLAQLSAIVGREFLLTAPEELAVYAYDATPEEKRPDAVALPGTTEQIAQILLLANQEGFPVIPRGSGTNLSGGTVPHRGGLVLALTRMNRLLEVDEKNLTTTLQPGVILAELRRTVESQGLFYPPDPASLNVCTVGGTVAEGAGGLSGVKYGTTKDYVLGLEVVLPTGQIIRTGGRTVKNRAGYDLTHLMVGSEGTLGVVTEITLKLIPLPETRRTCLAVFDVIEQAAETVSAVIRKKAVPRAMELIDDLSLRCIEAYRPTGLPLDAEAVLLIEVDGTSREVDYQMERVLDTCHEHHARQVKVAASDAEAEALWTARRAHYPAVARVRPNIIIEDVTVPRQNLPAMVHAVKEAAQKHQVQIGMVVHAGDGNLHPDILLDAHDKEELDRAKAFLAEVVKQALELKGTISGEHGIGSIKAPYLPLQLGKEGIEALRHIKAALDPKGILNPGKVLQT